MRCSIVIVLCLCIYCSCDNISTYPISSPVAALDDDRLIGNWKFDEDTNSNNFYEVTASAYPHQYHVRFFNRGGTNPTYEGNIYFSEIEKTKFLNLPYWEGRFENMGYMFLKIIFVNDSFTSMTAAVVGDTTMRALNSEDAVYKYIDKNINNRNFYSDTIHLYKVE